LIKLPEFQETTQHVIGFALKIGKNGEFKVKTMILGASFEIFEKCILEVFYEKERYRKT